MNVTRVKVGVIGSRGQLGRMVTADLRTADYDILEYDLPEFNGTDFAAMGRMVRACDAVVNCAENSARYLGDNSPHAAYGANILLPGHLSEHAAILGRYAVHLSTAAVFGGVPQQKMFAEDDETYSINGYQRSRINGEKAFLLHGCHGAIVRLGWLYGLPEGDFISRWESLARRGETLTAQPEMNGAPTPATLVLRMVRWLLRERAEGIFHLAARGRTSRAGAAAMVVEELASASPVVEAFEGGADDDPVFPAGLDCRRVDRMADFKRPEWHEALAEFLRRTPEERV